MDTAEEMTAVAVVRLLAFSPQDEEGIGQQRSREALVSSLERDLQGPRVRVTLHGLCDMLVDGEQSHRAAVGQVLDTVSWEAFGLVVGCLERFATSPSSSSSGSVTGTIKKLSDEEKTSRDADDCAALAERLALALAEIFSPKELHLMTLEHLHAYTKARTLRMVLAILRRSTQRMATARRSKFLEASLRPALEATKRVGLVAAAGDAPADPGLPQKPSGGYDDEDPDDDGTGRDKGEELPPPPLPTADGDMPSRAAYDAATSAAETAADFIGPLMEQASSERALLTVSGLPTARRGEGKPAAAAAAAAAASTSAGESGRAVGSGEKEGASASNLSLAAYIGFALSALEFAGETSVCCTATAAAAPPTLVGSEDKAPAVEALTRAEERLVGIIVDSPPELRFVLLHGCRVSYAGRVKRRRRRREGGGEEGESHSRLPAAGSGGAVGLGEAAVSGALPWTLRGVSTLAYLVACEPTLREKWLPLVWSRRTKRWLFLPHAEVLMRDRSKRVANKGLELACFVAERLGGFPDGTGAFAFDWEPGDEDIDGAGDGDGGGEDGAWNSGGREERDAGSSTIGEGRSPSSPRRPFDPHRVDLAGFLQVLVDVMVSCPLPGLRARGHSALVALLSAADEASRFRVLRRLVERCPWPNARGLLLDAFRREIDRALRQFGIEDEEQQQQQRQQAAPAAPSSSSPFASALAGDVVCEQLRKACRRGPLASLMADMDSRTGGLVLARHAHSLDAVGGARDGSGGAKARAAWGRLELREPEKLLQNRLLVQGLLDELQGAVITADNAGPEHFRLFILEDAAQQCLQELERAVVVPE